eukprot:52464-Eustigmatos_ZCMA.PRE.1
MTSPFPLLQAPSCWLDRPKNVSLRGRHSRRCSVRQSCKFARTRRQFSPGAMSIASRYGAVSV